MSTDTEKQERDNLLAAEYALGVLSREERTAFAARLEHEPHLRELVRSWDENLISLADDVQPVAPPPQVLTALEKRLFTPANTNMAPRAAWWNSLALWRGLSVASLAGLIVIAGLYMNARELAQNLASAPPPVTYVSELDGEQQAVRLIALYEAGHDVLKLHRTHGQAPENRSFELWYIGDDGVPKSLGVLPVDANGVIELPEDARDTMLTATLAITEEPAGGSPSGEPTGDVLASGKLSEI